MPQQDDDADNLIRELIPWYLISEKENLVLFEQALVDRNFSELIRLGDKMYGHGKTYGFPTISTLGKRIEIAAIQQDADLLKDLIISFSSYLEDCLKKYNLQ